MGKLINRLRNLLQANFQGAEITLEQVEPLAKIGGLLLWSGFDGFEQIDRQSQLWGVIRVNLSRAEQLKITAILTMTPEEAEALKD